jgi:hypothetical protein
MKHNVGDLVARIRIDTENRQELSLGYISRITSEYGHGYFVYFFDWDKDLWYLEKDVDHFKQVLESWSKNG